jgi:hypothetical protein
LIFRSFKLYNWLRHKTFKLHTFNACKWPRLAKNKIFSQNVSLKINRLNQLITKLACLMQHWRKRKPKYWWNSGSKAEKRKFQDVSKSEFSWLIDDSKNCVMYCYVCRKAGPDIAGKTEFVTGKKFKCEKSCLSK